MKFSFTEVMGFIRKIPNWPKYVVIVFLIFALVGIFNEWYQNRERLLSLKRDYQQLSSNLAASESKFSTLSDVKKSLEENIQEKDKVISLLKQQNLDLRSVGTTKGNIPGSSKDTGVEPGKEVYTDLLAFGNGLPVARAEFNTKEPAWHNKVFGIDFEVNTVIATDKNGLDQVITQVNAYNNELEETKGKPFPVAVTSSSFKQVLPDTKTWHFINPKLDLAASGGVSWKDLSVAPSITPELGFSMMGYGLTSEEETWRFLRVSAGYDAYNRTARGGVGLAGYNLGTVLPLVDDLWLWPVYTVDHEGRSGFSLSIGTNL